MTGEKVNPTFRIIKRLFNVRQTVPHEIIPFRLLLILLSTVLPYATAQPGWDSSEDPYGVNANVNSSVVIIIVSVVCLALFICMFSVFLRQCMASRSTAAAANGQGDARFRRVPAGGLNPAVIEMFPIFIYSEVKDLKIGKGALECAVCLNEFVDDDSLRLIPKCDHVFHPDCIDPWLASHTTCPVCRTDLLPDYDAIRRDTTQTHDSNESPGEENPRSELNDAQNQVSISIDGDRSRDSQALEIENVNQIPKLTPVPRSRSISTTSLRIAAKFPRSHTTGHSLVQRGESSDSYTLRLPEELREEIAMRMKLKLSTSNDTVLPREGSSRRGSRNSEGTGSSRWNWKWYMDRQFGQSLRFARSDRWVFSMVPPVLSRVAPIESPGTSDDGGSSSAANAKGPKDCLAVKAVQAEQSSDRSPV